MKKHILINVNNVDQQQLLHCLLVIDCLWQMEVMQELFYQDKDKQ